VISLIFYLTYFFYFNFEQCVKTGLLKKLCLIFTFVELDMTYVLSSPFGDGLILDHVLTTKDALFVAFAKSKLSGTQQRYGLSSAILGKILHLVNMVFVESRTLGIEIHLASEDTRQRLIYRVSTSRHNRALGVTGCL
jgi:hypothetical protein